MTGRPDTLDSVLLIGFLLGIYLSWNLELSAGVPVPAAPAAAASGLLLLRHVNWIEARHVTALAVVMLCYLLSVFTAPDYAFLMDRLKGFMQVSYSLVAGYGFYLVAIRYDRRVLARFFLVLCLLILIGAALENYTGFRAVSDNVRAQLYSFGVYGSDNRDELLYGIIRPKLFTSEPSYVTFGFSLFLFGWYGLTTSRYRIPAALAMLGLAYVLMRGPTLLLMPLLIALYELLVGVRKLQAGRMKQSPKRLVIMALVSLVLVTIGLWAGSVLYAERLQAIFGGSDPSFFYRAIGPALAAFDTIARYPFTGVGITGENFIGDRIVAIYIGSPAFSPEWMLEDEVAHILTNYFWSHWIYFGLGWGLVLAAALSYFLRTLGVPNVAFCWAVWAVFGQSMGAYVSPRTWTVMFLAVVVAVVNERQAVHAGATRRAVPRPGDLAARPPSARGASHARVAP
jgi:hypothetical protein